MRSTPASDRALARQALAGSFGAFEQLFERHFDRVHAWTLRHTESTSDAEHATARGLEYAFSRLERIARGEDLALRAMGAARASLRSRVVHDSAIESPR